MTRKEFKNKCKKEKVLSYNLMLLGGIIGHSTFKIANNIFKNKNVGTNL